MKLKTEKVQLQFSRKLRNSESPQLTRLSNQINDLKRKIATIQIKQSQKGQKLLTKSSSIKHPYKHQQKSKIIKQQIVKSIPTDKYSQNQASRAQNQILNKLQLFQQQFQDHANRIHQFIKKLRNELKLMQQQILKKLKKMKDQITQNVDKDVTRFIKIMKKYDNNGSPSQLDFIMVLKQQIKNKLQYTTQQIDIQLMELQYQIVQTTKNIQFDTPAKNNINVNNKNQKQYYNKKQISNSIKVSRQYDSPIKSVAKNIKTESSKNIHLKPDTHNFNNNSRIGNNNNSGYNYNNSNININQSGSNNKNFLHHLQEQRKQYKSAKLLLNL